MRKEKHVRERRLLALRMSVNQRLDIPGGQKTIMVNDLLNNMDLASQSLSKVCLNVSRGTKEDKKISRILDILVYGKLIEDKADHIAQAIKENR